MGKDGYINAENDYRNALKFDADLDALNRSMLRHNLAILLSEYSGSQEEIVSLWEESIQIDPRFVWSYVYFGKYYFNILNDPINSLNCLYKGLEIAQSRGYKEIIRQINDLIVLIKNSTVP